MLSAQSHWRLLTSCGWIMFVTHVMNAQLCLEVPVRNSTHFPQTIPSAGSEARSLPHSPKFSQKSSCLTLSTILAVTTGWSIKTGVGHLWCVDFSKQKASNDWVLHRMSFIPSCHQLSPAISASTIRHDLPDTKHPNLPLPSAEIAAAQ